MLDNQELINPSMPDEIEDNTGIEEIQKAMRAIDQLKDGQLPEDDKDIDKDNDNEEPDTEVGEFQETEEEVPHQKSSEKDIHLWQIKKEKYRLLAANEALNNEKKQMERMLAQATHDGIYHYGKNIYIELERTQTALKEAMEAGDADSVVKNIALVSKVQAKVDQLEENIAKSSTPPPPTTQESHGDSYFYQEVINDWMREHPDCDPSSQLYNPEVANKVSTYISSLDKQLTNSGRQDIYFSQPYFDSIDQYLANIKTQSIKNGRIAGAANYVGSVRNHHSNSVNGARVNPTKITLTSDEKIMCANANIPEKEWLKYKLEELNLKGNRV